MPLGQMEISSELLMELLRLPTDARVAKFLHNPLGDCLVLETATGSRLPISTASLIDLLHLPKDTRIVDAACDTYGHTGFLLVSHPDIRETPAPLATELRPHFSRKQGGEVVFEGWE